MSKGFVVIIGLGQLGRVFAGGFLRKGLTVVPVNRGDDMDAIAAGVPAPELALVAVAEPDLHPVLAALPGAWRDRVGLLQNELLPRDWERHGIAQPTVAIVWFEKKAGSDVKPLLPTPVHGPKAALIVEALGAIGIPARVIPDEAQRDYELVRKNLYILTTNVAGLEVGGSTGELWTRHRALAEAVGRDVLALQLALARRPLDPEALFRGFSEAVDADPHHLCRGRSAVARLQRALAEAERLGLEVPALRAIAARHT